MDEFNREQLKTKTLNEFRQRQLAAPKQEELDYEDSEEDSETLFEKFRLIAPVIAIAIVCFISYAWYTDKFTISSNNESDIPVIKADKDPLREKPEDPGGMKIVNRDKRVYDAISGKDNDKDQKAANVLPAPEEPVSHDQIAKKDYKSPEFTDKTLEKEETPADMDAKEPASGGNVASVDNDNKTDSAKQDVAKEEAKQEVKQEIKEQPKQVAELAPETAPVVQKVEEKPAATAPKEDVVKAVTKPAVQVVAAPAKSKAKEESKAVTADNITDVVQPKKAKEPAKAKKAEAKGYRLQLGSYKSEGDANSSWKSIKKKFSDVLTGTNYYIEKADLGEKGVFYRLQLSGFKNETDARKVCQKLTEKKQGCFFVGK